MADKMMRMAGRGEDGLAKAIRTDSKGKIKTSVGATKTLRNFRTVTIPAGTAPHVLSLGYDIDAPYVEFVLQVRGVRRGVKLSPSFTSYHPDSTYNPRLTHPEQLNVYLNEWNSQLSISSILPLQGNMLSTVRLWSLDEKEVEVDLFIFEVYEKPEILGNYGHYEYQTYAEERIVYFDIKEFVYITNDSDDDIYFDINYHPTPQWIKLKAGETISNLKLPAQRMKIKGNRAGQTLRILGVK